MMTIEGLAFFGTIATWPAMFSCLRSPSFYTDGELLLLGSAVGPFALWSPRYLTRCAFALADGISVRDGASLNEAAMLGAGQKTVRAFDFTGLMGSSASRNTTAADPRYLAISVTDIHGSEGRALKRYKFIDILVAALGSLLSARPRNSRKSHRCSWGGSVRATPK